MNKIVGYFSDKPTWKLVSENDYRKKFSYSVAIHYLKHEILGSVEREMTFVQSGTAVGFYAGLRFLFPEISHLAHLYYGRNWNDAESRYASRYMRKFKILYPGCGLYYEAFRHGLMHSHHPKWLSVTKSGWYVSNVAKLANIFGIFIPEFTNQVKAAIEMFIQELESEERTKRRNRFNKFFDALVDSGQVIEKKDLRGYAKYDS